MFKLVVVGTILGFAAAYHPVNQEIIDQIRNTATWKAMDLERNPLAGKSYEAIQGLLGTSMQMDENMAYAAPLLLESVPTNFDARTAFPGCVHDIRDQQQCGSCWAFAGSEVLSDRFCIASKGAVNTVLSPEDLVACDSTNQGCNGGILGLEWKYLENQGIVSDACFPYTSGAGKVPSCASSCVDGETYRNAREAQL